MKESVLELIWSYWHEEGGLVQTMNVLSVAILSVVGSWWLLLLIKKLARELYLSLR
jgi:hypothetical protein